MQNDPVTVVGAGIAGAACAVALRDAGVAVGIVDRGRAPGGRMCSPELYGRRVDIGATYFTVSDPDFAAVVARWESQGLARAWTDTFDVLGSEPTTGPMRWAAPGGLRTLVRELLAGFEVQLARECEALPAGPVVVAMPDPQAAQLVAVPDAVGYDPVIAVACGFESRSWPIEHGAFVNDHPVVSFVADDGSRRGDGAPVLVAHTTAGLARAHLDAPAEAVPTVVGALDELLGCGAPAWTHAHRWTYAKPADRHPAPFALLERDGRPIGLAGDQYCPDGAPRVESAWLSGTRLAAALPESGGQSP